MRTLSVLTAVCAFVALYPIVLRPLVLIALG